MRPDPLWRPSRAVLFFLLMSCSGNGTLPVQPHTPPAATAAAMPPPSKPATPPTLPKPATKPQEPAGLPEDPQFAKPQQVAPWARLLGRSTLVSLPQGAYVVWYDNEASEEKTASKIYGAMLDADGQFVGAPASLQALPANQRIVSMRAGSAAGKVWIGAVFIEKISTPPTESRVSWAVFWIDPVTKQSSTWSNASVLSNPEEVLGEYNSWFHVVATSTGGAIVSVPGDRVRCKKSREYVSVNGFPVDFSCPDTYEIWHIDQALAKRRLDRQKLDYGDVQGLLEHDGCVAVEISSNDEHAKKLDGKWVCTDPKRAKQQRPRPSGVPVRWGLSKDSLYTVELLISRAYHRNDENLSLFVQPWARKKNQPRKARFEEIRSQKAECVNNIPTVQYILKDRTVSINLAEVRRSTQRQEHSPAAWTGKAMLYIGRSGEIMVDQCNENNQLVTRTIPIDVPLQAWAASTGKQWGLIPPRWSAEADPNVQCGIASRGLALCIGLNTDSAFFREPMHLHYAIRNVGTTTKEAEFEKTPVENTLLIRPKGSQDRYILRNTRRKDPRQQPEATREAPPLSSHTEQFLFSDCLPGERFWHGKCESDLPTLLPPGHEQKEEYTLLRASFGEIFRPEKLGLLLSKNGKPPTPAQEEALAQQPPKAPFPPGDYEIQLVVKIPSLGGLQLFSNTLALQVRPEPTPGWYGPETLGTRMRIVVGDFHKKVVPRFYENERIVLNQWLWNASDKQAHAMVGDSGCWLMHNEIHLVDLSTGKSLPRPRPWGSDMCTIMDVEPGNMRPIESFNLKYHFEKITPGKYKIWITSTSVDYASSSAAHKKERFTVPPQVSNEVEFEILPGNAPGKTTNEIDLH